MWTLYEKEKLFKHEYLVCSNNRDGYDDCENKTGIRYDELSNLILYATNKKIKKFYDAEELENLNSDKVNTRFQKKLNL